MTAPRALAHAERLAALLVAVRDGAPLLDPPPPELAPADAESAYAAAHCIVAALEPRLGAVQGYKVGATSVRGQQMLGLAEPFYGCDFAQTIFEDGGEWPADGVPCTVEAEVGFVLARDLPARGTPYDEVEVRAALACAVPLLEINRPAYAKPFAVGGLWLVADNGVTQGLVTGGPGCTLADGRSLAGETVRMTRNGEPCAEGTASAVLGEPLRAVHWLANALHRHGRSLCAGDIVASGAMTPAIPMAPGDVFAAAYATLGSVHLRVAGSTEG